MKAEMLLWKGSLKLFLQSYNWPHWFIDGLKASSHSVKLPAYKFNVSDPALNDGSIKIIALLDRMTKAQIFGNPSTIKSAEKNIAIPQNDKTYQAAFTIALNL